MAKTVLLKGPMTTFSGYGVHARQIARWLFANAEKYDLDITCDLLNWGITPWITDITACDGLVAQMIQATQNVKPYYDLSIQLQLPNEWNPMLATQNIGVTAAVECTRCNPAWIDAANRMTMIVVPSEFTKKVMVESGELTVPIVVVPESFPDVILDDANVQVPELNLETEFNFLVVGQFTGNNVDNDRKNIPYTIKWLNEVFAEHKDVGIVLKTNMARQSALDRKATMSTLARLMAETRVSLDNPKWYLLHGQMTDAEMAGLYRHPKIRALVSLTRGEGFNLPALEAAASGLPVMITGWSAHTEFLGLGRYIAFDHKIDEIHPSRVDNTIFMPGAQWAHPIEADVKRRLVRFYDKPEIPKEWAADLKAKIRAAYSFEAIQKKYDEVLGPTLLSTS